MPVPPASMRGLLLVVVFLGGCTTMQQGPIVGAAFPDHSSFYVCEWPNIRYPDQSPVDCSVDEAVHVQGWQPSGDWHCIHEVGSGSITGWIHQDSRGALQASWRLSDFQPMSSPGRHLVSMSLGAGENRLDHFAYSGKEGSLRLSDHVPPGRHWLRWEAYQLSPQGLENVGLAWPDVDWQVTSYNGSPHVVWVLQDTPPAYVQQFSWNDHATPDGTAYYPSSRNIIGTRDGQPYKVELRVERVLVPYFRDYIDVPDPAQRSLLDEPRCSQPLLGTMIEPPTHEA